MFTRPIISRMTGKEMDPTAKRLYLAARHLANTTGQSAVAAKLGVSPQMVKNWETRGVSYEGMITAEERFGCLASWIHTGKGSMSPAGAHPSTPASSDSTSAQGSGNVIDLSRRAIDNDEELREILRLVSSTDAKGKTRCLVAVEQTLAEYSKRASAKKGRRKSSS